MTGLLLSHISLPICLLPTIYHSKTPTQSLIFWFRPWSSDSETKPDLRDFSLHLIDSWSILSPHHPPSPWYSSFTYLFSWSSAIHNRSLANTHSVPDFLVSSLVFCFKNKIIFSKIFLAHLVHPLSLPTTQSLVFSFQTSHSLVTCPPTISRSQTPIQSWIFCFCQRHSNSETK